LWNRKIHSSWIGDDGFDEAEKIEPLFCDLRSYYENKNLLTFVVKLHTSV